MKIVVTMTSWTKRIGSVGEAIFRFMTTQTVKPDIFYLWLAEEEFPQKEKELPRDLLLTCNFFKVQICWTKNNEYCFKRWRVFPQHYDDLVMSIDDDQIYDPDIIELALKKYNALKRPCVLSYQNPGYVLIDGCEYKYKPLTDYTKVSASNFFLGQTIFSPKSFPCEIFSSERWKAIKTYCPKCDESVIHPFLVKHKIPIAFISSKQKMTGIKELQKDGLMNEMWDCIKIGGKSYRRTSVLKYVVLKVLPELQQEWLNTFPNYEINHFNNTSIEELRFLCNKTLNLSLISDDCLGGFIYRDVLKTQYTSPFVWTRMYTDAFIQFIGKLNTIDLHNIDVIKERGNNNKFGVLIDSTYPLWYHHITFNANANTPKKKKSAFGIDLEFNMPWQYIHEQYETRLSRLKQNKIIVFNDCDNRISAEQIDALKDVCKKNKFGLILLSDKIQTSKQDDKCLYLHCDPKWRFADGGWRNPVISAYSEHIKKFILNYV